MEKFYLLRIQLNYVIGNYYQCDKKKMPTGKKTGNFMKLWNEYRIQGLI